MATTLAAVRPSLPSAHGVCPFGRTFFSHSFASLLRSSGLSGGRPRVCDDVAPLSCVNTANGTNYLQEPWWWTGGERASSHGIDCGSILRSKFTLRSWSRNNGYR